MWKCSKRCQQYCTAAAYRTVKRGRTHYHRARLLKEQSLGPEVLTGVKKTFKKYPRSEMGGDSTDEWLRSSSVPFPREGRMLRAVPDPTTDLLPRKNTCGGEKSGRKGPGERGERRKRERARKTASKGFLFLNTTVLSRKIEMNRTNRFLIPLDPEACCAPQTGKAGLAGPAGFPSPPALPRPAGLTSLRPRRPPGRSRAPVQVPAGGAEPTLTCLPRDLYRAGRGGGLIGPAAPSVGVAPRRPRQAAPHAPPSPPPGSRRTITN